MSNIITVKTGSNAPDSSALLTGELGYDSSNKRLYIGNGAGVNPTPLSDFPPDINRFGFLNQTETSFSFDGTSIFTLTDEGNGWSYYRLGIKCTISGNKSIDLLTVDNPLVDGEIYYIYIDAIDGTLSAGTSPWTLQDSWVPVAYLIWNNTLTPKYLIAEERHSCAIDRRMHYYEHFTSGTKAISCGALSGYTINTDTNVAKTFAIGASRIVDEDIIIDIDALSDPDGSATDYTLLYRTSSNTWAWKASNMPFVYNIGNTNDWIQWDNAGTMTDATGGTGANTRWINSYLLLTNFQGTGNYTIIPGQHIYTSLANALGESVNDFTWDGFPIVETVIAYKLTWTTYTSTSQGKCMLAIAPTIVNLSTIDAVGTGVAVEHNSTVGKQGGTTGEYYHLTATEYAALDDDYTGADASNTGVHGLVPAAEPSESTYFLRGTGTWIQLTPALIGAAAQQVGSTATLTSTSWSDVYYTVSLSGVTSSSIIEILPALTISSDQLSALQGANLQDAGQSTDSFTLIAFGDVPTIDVPIRIITRGDLY